MNFTIPCKCGAQVEVSHDQIGTTVECPACGQPFLCEQEAEPVEAALEIPQPTREPQRTAHGEEVLFSKSGITITKSMLGFDGKVIPINAVASVDFSSHRSGFLAPALALTCTLIAPMGWPSYVGWVLTAAAFAWYWRAWVYVVSVTANSGEKIHHKTKHRADAHEMADAITRAIANRG